MFFVENLANISSFTNNFNNFGNISAVLESITNQAEGIQKAFGPAFNKLPFLGPFIQSGLNASYLFQHNIQQGAQTVQKGIQSSVENFLSLGNSTESK